MILKCTLPFLLVYFLYMESAWSELIVRPTVRCSEIFSSEDISQTLIQRHQSSIGSALSHPSNLLIDRHGFRLSFSLSDSQSSKNYLYDTAFFLFALRSNYGGDVPLHYWGRYNSQTHLNDFLTNPNVLNSFIDSVSQQNLDTPRWVTGAFPHLTPDGWEPYRNPSFRQLLQTDLRQPHQLIYRVPSLIQATIGTTEYSIIDGNSFSNGSLDEIPDVNWAVDNTPYLDLVMQIYSERLGIHPEQLNELKELSQRRMESSIVITERQSLTPLTKYDSGLIIVKSDTFIHPSHAATPIEVTHSSANGREYFSVRSALNIRDGSSFAEVGRHIRVNGNNQQEQDLLKLAAIIIGADPTIEYVVVEADMVRKRLWERMGFRSMPLHSRPGADGYYPSNTDYMLYIRVDDLLSYLFP